MITRIIITIFLILTYCEIKELNESIKVLVHEVNHD